MAHTPPVRANNSQSFQSYRVSYSVGTSRQDEKRYVKTFAARDFADAARIAQRHVDMRPNAYLTGIELAAPLPLFA